MRTFALSFLLAAATVASAQTLTPIGTIQGTGSAATAGTFTVEGVVTAVYPSWSPAGYYVQNDAATADGNPATSDALFVVQASPTVAVGNRLRLSGTVRENGSTPSFGQAVLTGATATVLAASAPLPAFAVLDNATLSAAALEPYEGMRVQFNAPVTITDVENLKQRGELSISLRGLAYQPTQVVDPNDNPASGTSSSGSGNVPAVQAYATATLDKTLLLDDGSADPAPSPTPYIDATLGTVRVGSTVASLRGIMGYGSGAWRVQPLAGTDAPAVLTTRPAVPTFGPLDVKLASFNVLNYFNGDGVGGGFPTARGAKTMADFERQRSKIVAAIAQMDADVVGLLEIENDGTGPNSALQDLVHSLNRATALGTYALVDDGAARQAPTSDLIRCAIIYKPAAVRLVGPALLSSSSTFDRSPLAQLFAAKRAARQDTFAFVINHLKSKASGSGANADQGDGQGRSNLRRVQQAQALVQFINNTVLPAGTGRVVSVGDYNANYEEDPLDVLRAAGLLLPAPFSSVSYVFNGLSGSLDHAVITPALAGQTEIHKWNINAAEPEFLEYDVAGAATDVSSPFRSSDHDPVLIGLNFALRPTATATAGAAPAPQLLVYPNPTDSVFTLSLTNIAPATPLTLELLTTDGKKALSLRSTAAALPAELRQHSARLVPGTYVLRVKSAGLNLTQRVIKR